MSRYPRRGQSQQTKIELLEHRTKCCEGQLKSMTRRNLELYLALERVVLAVENHKINTEAASPVDLKLWESLEDTIIFTD